MTEDGLKELRYASDAEVVDLAGRQRMLNQRLIKECLARCLKVRTGTANHTRTAELLRNTALRLARGGAISMVPGQEPDRILKPPPTQGIAVKLEEQVTLSESVGRQVRLLLGTELDELAFHDRVHTLLEAGEAFHREADAAVKLLSQHFQEEKAALESTERALTRSMDRVLTVVAAQSAELVSSAARLSTNGRLMTESARYTSEQARMVSDATSRLNSGVSRVATATEEIDTSIREIGIRTLESAKQANEAEQYVTAAKEAIRLLSESSSRIGEVIKFIQQVATHTNLLALNAKIEAARAGSAGRGFAVVADEVRDLARQTAKAATEIADSVSSIQRDTEATRQTVDQLRPVVGLFNEMSSDIARAVGSHEQATSEIAGQLARSARDLKEISDGTDAVASAAAQVASSAADSNDAASALESLSRELRTVTDSVQRGSTPPEPIAESDAPEPLLPVVE